MTQVRTRFSPSPTGALHLGGAHTALFNWLYARHFGGVFILRIEDTDKERSQEKFVDEIQESLRWLGLDWDEGPYRQSQRLTLYHEYIKRLVEDGHAYYCDCDPDELEIRRQAALARGEKPRYDRHCRDRGLAPGPKTAVRFKTPETGTTYWHDGIKDYISFDNQELDDLVLLRADGIPTYNLAVVVDDITMGVTHIIRGDDHISNTPRQILIYQALGVEPPLFAHMPLMLGKDRSKLSKRHGALPVLAYREQGILPQSLDNFLARLGWSHGDQEIFSMAELIEYFDLDHVGKSPGIFDEEKLLWLNSHYIRETPPRELAALLIPYLAAIGVENPDPDYVARIVPTLNKRSKTLVEMADAARFYFVDPRPYDEKAARKFLTPAAIFLLRETAARLEALSELSEESLTDMLKGICADRGCKLVDLAQPVRVALTGKGASPSLTELIPVLGQEECLRRLNNAINSMANLPFD
jgi:glutamyl-tRNA synthetase